MSGGTTEGDGQHAETTDHRAWYGVLRDELREKAPRDVAREVPGLVDHLRGVAEGATDADRLLVGVSFTTNHTCLDYCIDRVVEPTPDGPRVEAIKEPVSDTHRYVRFAYLPDPHFDPRALRALLLSAVDREYRNADEEHSSGLARVWENFGGVE